MDENEFARRRDIRISWYKSFWLVLEYSYFSTKLDNLDLRN